MAKTPPTARRYASPRAKVEKVFTWQHEQTPFPRGRLIKVVNMPW